MQGNNNIRWSKRDEEKLNKLVRNFNAKVMRILKKDPEMINYVPERLSKKELKKQLKNGSRKNFNTTLKDYSRFLKKGSEQLIKSETGNVVTKYEKKDIQLKVNRINKERKKELDRLAQLNPEIKEEKHNVTGDTAIQNLKPKPFNFNKIKKGREWEMFKETVEKQSKEDYNIDKYEEYKRRYLLTIENNLGEMGKALYDYVNSLPAKYVHDAFYVSPFLSLRYIYAPEEQGFIADTVLENWENLPLEL